ncbi:circadian locomoter output cycles protein kaput [Anopheles maculipalpis]|uniref:circadian locomoter output cycles protein kaput n=1 Tax=Anopheles maculipalpis TaxID=1496333 RepID=UPI0021593CD3|nr:circadian locomoter output cycles protein kaput [Anopheles maculipalpis]
MDEDPDDKDDTKRKSRNLSEKKRRDQFNLLVNELSSMVSSNSRKMDKSTVLKSTIAFLKSHNEIAVRSRVHEIQTDWKPSFLSNEEFTHLILEALDGFIIVFSSTGRVFYASESITSLLGHLPSDLLNMTVYDMVYEDDQNDLYNILLNPTTVVDPLQTGISRENQVTFSCYIKRGTVDYRADVSYEHVQFTGYFRSDVDTESLMTTSRFSGYTSDADSRLVFVGTGRLQTPQLIREMSIVDNTKSEFTSRHSLEWKFLFLDHRAPPIIGYLPFEVLGTSGYDYYHFDDLEKVVACHEALMQKGEGTSCYYRFLTKGQQWIWLQTRFYITYHQWNSKPEFVVCTHRVVSYADVMKQMRNQTAGDSKFSEDADSISVHGVERKFQQSSSQSLLATSPWSSKSSRTSRVAPTPGVSPTGLSNRGRHRYNTYHGPGSDSATSISTESHTSRQSLVTQHSRSRMRTSTFPSKVSSHGSQPDRNSMSHFLLQQPQHSQANVGHHLQPSQLQQQQQHHLQQQQHPLQHQQQLHQQSHPLLQQHQQQIQGHQAQQQHQQLQQQQQQQQQQPQHPAMVQNPPVVDVYPHQLQSQHPHQQTPQQQVHQQQQQQVASLQQQQSAVQQQQQQHQQLQQQQQQQQQQSIPQPSTTSAIRPPATIITPPVTQIITATGFIEPQQYLTAIPVQPVAGFTETAPGVLSPIQSTSPHGPYAVAHHPAVTGTGGVVLTPSQNQVQDQLQRKHEELQHLILQQQEELRRVQEQLLMARYGLLPSIVSLPFPPGTGNGSGPGPSVGPAERCNSGGSFLQAHHQAAHGNSFHHHHYHPASAQHPPSHSGAIHAQQSQHHGQQPQQLSQDQQQQQQQMCIAPPDQKPILHSDPEQLNFTDTGQGKLTEPNEMISYMQLTPVPLHHLQQHQSSQSSTSTPASSVLNQQQQQQQKHHHQQQQQLMQMGAPPDGGTGTSGNSNTSNTSNNMGLLQYQMAQEQAQILFTSGMEQQQGQQQQQPPATQQQHQGAGSSDAGSRTCPSQTSEM